MKDPREYATWLEWSIAGNDESVNCGRMALVYDDICARLNAKDAEIEKLTAANHSVRVCANHTSEIVGDGCAICEIAALRDLAADAVSGLRYIEQQYGRLYGVGWHRVFGKAARLLDAAQRREGEGE